jgi:hypothetical protein
MPSEYEPTTGRLVERVTNPMLFEQLVEGLAVQSVEVNPLPFTGSHPAHRGQVAVAPFVCEGAGVKCSAALCGDLGDLVGDAGAPVNRGTEDVEGEHRNLPTGLLHSHDAS